MPQGGEHRFGDGVPEPGEHLQDLGLGGAACRGVHIRVDGPVDGGRQCLGLPGEFGFAQPVEGHHRHRVVGVSGQDERVAALHRGVDVDHRAFGRRCGQGGGSRGHEELREAVQGADPAEQGVPRLLGLQPGDGPGLGCHG